MTSEITKFVILASARTGSSHLVGLLNNRRTILCNGEVFHKNKVYVRWPSKGQWDDEAKARLKAERDADPLAFMRRIYAETFKCQAVGFKLFPGHNKDVLAAVLNDPTIKKIMLYRDNVLAIYSSANIARSIGKFSYGVGVDVPERKKVRFVADEFITLHDRYIGHYRRAIETLNMTRQAFHLIEYTQLNETRLLQGVSNFIGIDPAKIEFSANNQKLNSPDIVSRFENPEAVEAFLQEHDRLHWRHEGRTSFSDWRAEVAEPVERADGDDEYDEEVFED